MSIYYGNNIISPSTISITISVAGIDESCVQNIPNVSIPSSVTSLNRYCLRDCKYVSSIVIPPSVTSLGDTCFHSSLSAVYFEGVPPTLAGSPFDGGRTFTAFTQSPASSECLLRLSAQGSTTSSIATANGVKDISGRGNHGTANAAVSVVTDTSVGDCFSFGTTAGKGMSSFPALPIYKEGMTYCFWISNITPKSTTGYAQVIRHFNETNMGIICQILDNAKGFRVGVYNSTSAVHTTYSQSTVLDSSKWYHIAFTVSESKGTRLYLNGSLVASNGSAKITSNWDSRTITINNSFTWSVKLEDIRVYARELSDSEIAKVYTGAQWTPKIKSPAYGNATSITWASIPTSPILALDALTSTTGSNGIKDISGNGYHGTISGTASIDKSSNSFVFDGTTNSSVDVTNASFLSAINGKSGYSISISACCANDSNPRVGGLVTGGSSLAGFFYFYSDHINFYDRMSSASDTLKSLVSDTNSISQGSYHTATATVDYATGTAILYIDGKEAKRSTDWHSGGTKNITTGVKLGRNTSSSGANFKGPARNFIVYDRVLTPAEVAALHDNTIKYNVKGVPYKISDITFGASCRCAIMLSSGEYAVTDWSNHCIRILNPDGTLKLTFGENGNGNGGFSNPYGICQDKDGYLYVSEYRGSLGASYYLQKFSYNGSVVTFVSQLQVPGAGHQITYNKTRNKIIVNAYGSGLVLQVPTDLSTYTTIATTSYSVGNAMSADGTILYYSYYHSAIYKAVYDSAETTTPSTTTTLVSGSGFQNLALSDDESFLVFMNSAENKIKKLNLLTNTVTELASGLAVIGVSNAGGNRFLFMAGPSDTTMLYRMDL